MKKLLYTSVLFVVSTVNAQITNNTTLTIESGLTLTAQDGVHITNTGFIDNAGDIRHTGTWQNDAANGGMTSTYGKVWFSNYDSIKGTEPTTFFDVGHNFVSGGGIPQHVFVRTNTGKHALEVNGQITGQSSTATLLFNMDNDTLLLKNGNANALTNVSFLTSLNQSSGDVVNNAVLKWEIEDNVGTYEVKYWHVFIDNFGVNQSYIYVPFSYEITSPGDNTGNIIFSNSSANYANAPLIAPINTLDVAGNDQSDDALNRFWKIDASSYTTQPTANATFTYENTNDLCVGPGCPTSIDPTTLALFQWDEDNSEWSTDYDLVTANLGNRTLTVSGINDATSWFMFTDKCAAFTVDAGSDVTCGGPSTDLEATATGSNGTISYAWSPSDSLSCTDCEDPTSTVNYTTTYTVTASDDNGCSAQDQVIVNIDAVQPEICLVTVDESSEHNVVVWDKTLYPNVDSFYVYRDVGPQYNKIGAVDYDELSEFIDLDATANPNATASNYKLSVFDNCGVEGEQSEYRRTIFTNQAQDNGATIQVTWFAYEGIPGTFFYKIRRDTLSNGDWEELNQVSSAGLLQFTDLDPPILRELNRYEVIVSFIGGCTSSKANSYGETRSNRQTISGGNTTIPTADFSEDNTTILMGQTVTFTDESNANPAVNQWFWSFENGTPSSSPNQNPTISYNIAGTHEVELIAINSLGRDTITKTGWITVGDAGIDELPGVNSMMLFPNPTKDNVWLSFNTSEAQNLSIELMKLDGQVIRTQNISGNGEIKTQVDLSGLAKSTYLIRIKSDKGSLVKRIVKN